MADHKKQMLGIFATHMSGRYGFQETFNEWVEMCAISIHNACHIVQGRRWRELEERYSYLSGKYTDEEKDAFAELLALLTQSLEDELTDVLGEVFMEYSMGEKSKKGQVFTPFCLSTLSARMVLDHDKLPDGIIRTHEPSCGSGAMVIALCKELRDKGINYQRRLEVICQDLDWRAVHMAYVQLSLIGCRAIVVQGDTLTDPYRIGYPRSRMYETPAWMGCLDVPLM